MLIYLKMWNCDVTILVFVCVISSYFTKSYCELPSVQLFRENTAGFLNNSEEKPYYWREYEDIDSEYDDIEYAKDNNSIIFEMNSNPNNIEDYNQTEVVENLHHKSFVAPTQNISPNNITESATGGYQHPWQRRHESSQGSCPDNKKCARKCCPFGSGFDHTENRCIPVSDEFNPSVWKGYTLMEDTNATNELHFLFGLMTCASGEAIKPVTGVRIQLDGTLLVERPAAMGPELGFKPNKYCMDLFITADNKTELNAIICHVRNTELRRHFIVIETCLVISCILILLNVIVYALLPELRTRHRIIIMAYLISFLLSFSVKSGEIILIMWEKSYRPMCIIFTFVFYFFFISGFFWRNIMCYDMWWTIRSKRPVSGRGSESRVRLALYFVYGFGMPGALTGLLAALEFSNITNDHPLMPKIRNEGCNSLYGYSKAIYQYGPVCILFAINLILFGATILKIKASKKETKKVLQSQDSKTHVMKNDKKWVNLYVKLFVVMLIAEVNCTLDFLSRLFPHIEMWCHLADLNILTVPFIVYLNYTCQGQSWKNIKSRCKMRRNLSEKTTPSSFRTTTTLTHSQDDSQNYNDCQKNPDIENQGNSINFSRSISVI